MKPGRERWIWLIAFALLVVGVLWTLVKVRSVSVPLLLAFLFAYVFHPLLGALERRGVPRSVASLSMVIGLGGLLGGGLVALAPPILSEIGELPARLLEAYQTAATWFEDRFGLQFPETRREIKEQLGGITAGEVAPLLRAVFGGTVGALGVIAGLALLPLLAFFLLRDLNLIFAWFEGLIPPRRRAAAIARFKELDAAVGGFVRGQLIVSGIMALLYSIGFSIVGLPLAIGVGVLAGVGNLIPYLGTALGILVATVLTFLHWSGFAQLLAVYLVFVVVQVVEGWFLTPKIVGQATGISPFGVIVAVLFFGALFGFLGLLLAVPLAAVVQLLARIALDHYRRSPIFRG